MQKIHRCFGRRNASFNFLRWIWPGPLPHFRPFQISWNSYRRLVVSLWHKNHDDSRRHRATLLLPDERAILQSNAAASNFHRLIWRRAPHFLVAKIRRRRARKRRHESTSLSDSENSQNADLHDARRLPRKYHGNLGWRQNRNGRSSGRSRRNGLHLADGFWTGRARVRF